VTGTRRARPIGLLELRALEQAADIVREGALASRRKVRPGGDNFSAPALHDRLAGPPDAGRTLARLGMMSRVRDKKVTVADLLAAGGISRATLYRWTERGLVPAPEGYEPGQRGPLAVYPPLALTRIQEIRALLDEGFTLAAIEKRLAKLSHT
jgi:hypothetical protein